MAVPEPAPPDAPLAQWAQIARGHEEVFVLAMAAPHAGPALVMGTADLGGFVWQGEVLSEYPDFSFFGLLTPGGTKQWGAEGVGVAYTEALAAGGGAPALIAVAHTRAYPGAPDLKLSADGGRSWAFTPSVNATLGAAAELLGVAVEAWPRAAAPTRMVLVVSNSTPWASADGGATWVRATGPLPSTPFPASGFSGNRYNMSRPLAADRPTAGPGGAGRPLFLVADCAAGRLLGSADGATWAYRGVAAAFPPTPRCVTPRPAGGVFGLRPTSRASGSRATEGLLSRSSPLSRAPTRSPRARRSRPAPSPSSLSSARSRTRRRGTT